MSNNVAEFMQGPSLFKALEFIGVRVVLEEQKEQKTGPVLFVNHYGSEALFLIRADDHQDFDEWIKRNPNPCEADIQKLARESLYKIMDKKRYEKLWTMIDGVS